jgi:uncharacterized cupredoxin-like copper-binding protein
MRRSLPLLLVFLGLLVLVLLPTTAAVAADEKSPAPAPTSAGSVEVHLTEYAIQMPATLPAGPTTFLLHNDGLKKHAFRIEGPGIEQTQSEILDPHSTANLQVPLQPGEYKVVCPIGSHSAKGMSLTLTVTAKPAG